MYNQNLYNIFLMYNNHYNESIDIMHNILSLLGIKFLSFFVRKSTGDSKGPLSVLDDQVIYQRGAPILVTVIEFLLNTTELGSAEKVIFSGTGCK